MLLCWVLSNVRLSLSVSGDVGLNFVLCQGVLLAAILGGGDPTTTFNENNTLTRTKAYMTFILAFVAITSIVVRIPNGRPQYLYADIALGSDLLARPYTSSYESSPDRDVLAKPFHLYLHAPKSLDFFHDGQSIFISPCISCWMVWNVVCYRFFSSSRACMSC